MGLMDKIMFWKKEPELELGKYPGLEAGPASAEMPAMGPGPSPGITEPPAPIGGPSPLEEIGPAPPPPTPLGRAPAIPAPTAFPSAAPSAVPAPSDAAHEMINVKLDTLKALLESINTRLERMERTQQARSVEEEELARAIPTVRRLR